jgi:predicted RNA-binding protein with PUA-like domain
MVSAHSHLHRRAHPYYDAKSDAASPKWHMVELRFVSRVPHFVPLALLRHISTLSEAPAEMNYLNSKDLKVSSALKNILFRGNNVWVGDQGNDTAQ